MASSTRALTENYVQRVADKTRRRDGDLAGQIVENLLSPLPEVFAFVDRRGFDPEARKSMLRLIPTAVRFVLSDHRVLAEDDHPFLLLFGRISEFASSRPDNQRDLDSWRHQLRRLVARIEEMEDVGSRSARTLIQEMDGFARRQERRRAAAERRARQVQAARNRLQKSREAAARMTAGLLTRAEAPPPLAELLSGPWENVIVLLCLRHGQAAPETTRAIKTAQTVLRWSTGKVRPLPEALAAELAEGLLLVGFIGDEARRHVAAMTRAVHRWRQSQTAASAPPPARGPARNAAGGDQAQAFAEPVDTAVAEDDPPMVPPPPAPVAQKAHSFLVGGISVQSGDWVEFLRSDGSRVLAKLSWVSPITQNLLFVDDRGIKVADLSLEAFKAEVAAREARVLAHLPRQGSAS